MIELKGVKYEATKMAPRLQQHVLRRLAPLLAMAGATLLGLLDETRDKAEVMAEIALTIGPVTQALAHMDDASVDYVMDACLLHVQKLDGEKWHPTHLRSGNGVVSKYQDIEGGAEMRLVVEVLKVNLEGFFEQLSGGTASPLSTPAS